MQRYNIFTIFVARTSKGCCAYIFIYIARLRLYPQNLTQVMLPQGLKTILSANRGKTSPNDV